MTIRSRCLWPYVTFKLYAREQSSRVKTLINLVFLMFDVGSIRTYFLSEFINAKKYVFLRAIIKLRYTWFAKRFCKKSTLFETTTWYYSIMPPQKTTSTLPRTKREKRWSRTTKFFRNGITDDACRFGKTGVSVAVICLQFRYSAFIAAMIAKIRKIDVVTRVWQCGLSKFIIL